MLKALEGAYQSQDLRKAIRDRFIWTLQLDKRYEVIAYSIAYGCLSDREKGINQGFSVNWIKDEVLEYWPEGFSSQYSDIPLDSLLEEMVGLGILREIKYEKEGACYTLRSANVLLLIGTEEEVLNQLVAPREPEPIYEPAVFRSAYRGPDQAIDYSKRNPLTALQEDKLRSAKNGVTIIIGTIAAGLNDLKDFIKAGYPEFFIEADDCTDNKDFFKKLDKLAERQQNGTTILYISHRCPWNHKWVEESIKRTNRMSSKDRFARIVFIADPESFWRLQDDFDYEIFSDVHIISLTPWDDSIVRHWLDDCHYQVSEDNRKQISEVTGNWSDLLAEFHKRANSDSSRWEEHLNSLKADLENENCRKQWLEKFGLSIEKSLNAIRKMAEWGESVTPEELAELLEIEIAEVQHVIRWAEKLAIIYKSKDGKYFINDVVAKLIRHP